MPVHNIHCWEHAGFFCAAAWHCCRYVYTSHVHLAICFQFIIPVTEGCGLTKQSASSGSRQSTRGLLCVRRLRCTCDLCNLHSGTVTSPAVKAASGSTSRNQRHTATQGMTSMQPWLQLLKTAQFTSAIMQIYAVLCKYRLNKKWSKLLSQLPLSNSCRRTSFRVVRGLQACTCRH